MLRLTACYADAWNTPGPGYRTTGYVGESPTSMPPSRGEGRDPRTLRRTVGLELFDGDLASANAGVARFATSIEDLARAVDAYEALGFDDLIVGLRPQTKRSLDRLADALRLLGRASANSSLTMSGHIRLARGRRKPACFDTRSSTSWTAGGRFRR
jgi:hypothetical protein